jgi:hypothetical protein
MADHFVFCLPEERFDPEMLIAGLCGSSPPTSPTL